MVAQKRIKTLVNGNVHSKSSVDRDIELANLISEIRQDVEALEGINSFLEKRKPSWVK